MNYLKASPIKDYSMNKFCRTLLRQENSKNATDDNEPCREQPLLLAARFISKLPELRRILATDVEAAYKVHEAEIAIGLLQREDLPLHDSYALQQKLPARMAIQIFPR